MNPVTRVGRSSRQIPVVRVNLNALLPASDAILPDDNWTPVPLAAEPMIVRGARKWIDAGMPDNTADEYQGWR